MRKKPLKPIKTSNICLRNESYFQYSFNAPSTAESSRASRVDLTSLGSGNPAGFYPSFAVWCLTPALILGTPAGWRGAAADPLAINTARGSGHKTSRVLLTLWAKRTRSHLGAKQAGQQGTEPQLKPLPLCSDLVPCRYGQRNAWCQTERPTDPLIDAQNPEGRFAVTFPLGELMLGHVWEFGKAASSFTCQSRAVLLPADTVSTPQSPIVPFELLPPLNTSAWKPKLKKS